VHQSIGRFRGDSQFYTWLYGVALNRWKDWQLSMSRRREEVIEGVFKRTAGSARSDAAAEHTEMVQMLTAALDEFPPVWRDVLVLREIDDLSYKEIAGQMECIDRHRQVAPFPVAYSPQRRPGNPPSAVQTVPSVVGSRVFRFTRTTTTLKNSST